MGRPLAVTLRWVIALNLGYFGVEATVAATIGSASLFADSVDFLEDAALNLLVLLALGWSAAARVRLGRVLALVLLAPVAATLATIWSKIGDPAVPDPAALLATGAGALVVNLAAAVLLSRHHGGGAGGSLLRAAFLSARNDALANAGIIGAAIVSVTVWPSAWPDIIVGAAIMALNAGAALEVWQATGREARAEDATP